jgi:proteasome lid subunit RPN8/RPN11
MAVMRWASKDKRFIVEVNETILTVIARHCERSKAIETGGVLVGRYAENFYVAVVTEIPPPPKDSKSSATKFKRGVAGLRQLFIERWNAPQRTYYIGEWHYHPAYVVEPSPDDFAQMIEFSYSAAYDCIAPIMIIAGTGKGINRPHRFFVFPRADQFIELFLQENHILTMPSEPK